MLVSPTVQKLIICYITGESRDSFMSEITWLLPLGNFLSVGKDIGVATFEFQCQKPSLGKTQQPLW